MLGVTNILDEDNLFDAVKHLSPFIFIKNSKLQYVWCNEKLAEISNLDSPKQFINKTDHDFSWLKAESDFFHRWDRKIFNGITLFNSIETLTSIEMKISLNIHGSKRLIHTKYTHKPLLVGIYYVDHESRLILPTKPNNKNDGQIYFDGKKLHLGNFFQQKTLTLKQIAILRALIMGDSAKEIATSLPITERTVQTHIDYIKRKLDCKNKAALIKKCHQYGLTDFLHYFDDKTLQKLPDD